MGRKVMLLVSVVSVCLLVAWSPISPRVANATLPHDTWAALGSPGDIVGTTHYDCQTNGSTGTRIVKDYLGGFHFTWMNGIGFWQGNRWVYYNFLDENGIWAWPEVGTKVNSTQGAGYPQVDVLSDGRAAIVYGAFTLAIDSLRGLGCFTEIPGPEPGAWPYQAIDRADRIHVVYYMNGGSYTLKYTRYENSSWTQPQLVDSLVFASAVITTSDISDRVAIAYTTRDPDDPDQIVDVFYIESEDGTNWNWSEKTNITNYQPQDTIRASTDLDAVYDLDDNLHVIWNTPLLVPPLEEGSGSCLLWHWSEELGITLVADGSWDSYPGAWNLTLAKMSIGVEANNNLFSVWTQFTEEDKSICAWSNGELFMSYSTDNGLRWSTPMNITNSPSPGCWPGECDSDHWSSLAEDIDNYLHIVYINDKDAGAICQTEGVDTENPVLYLKVHNPVSGVTISCENSSPWFCRGDKFYFKLTVSNNTGGNVSGTFAFSGYSGYDCDPANRLVTIPRSKTYPPGVTTTYYYFKVPNAVGPGQYSASIEGDLNPGEYEVFCCMNTQIVQCSPWKMGDNTEWELVEVERPEVETGLPLATCLLQNYPNPFNASTTIEYRLAAAGEVKLQIYNLAGQLMETLVNRHQEAGHRSETWDASGFPSGIYFCKLTATEVTEAKRMILIK